MVLSYKYYLVQEKGTMASKRENIKEREADRELTEIIDTTLDETRSSVNKATNEARKEIPQYRKAVDEYQEETLQATKDIAENFLESQKENIHSFQSTWIPYMENLQNSYWSYWTSPRRSTENYATAVSNLADGAIAATRLANNFLFASMDVWKQTMQQARDNAIEFSRLNSNVARNFENSARENLRDFRER